MTEQQGEESGAARRTARYGRQILFSGLGEAGQERLSRARVGVAGCGALGALVATLLARAGVGFLRLADRDVVELSNLHRQVLFTEADVAARLPKAVAAAEHLREANSEVLLEPLVIDLSPSTAARFADGLDLIVDGTDNFATRFLLNDLAVTRGLPWIYGGVIGGSGMTMSIVPGDGPCLRCLFREPPPPGTAPTCDTAGVLNTTVGVLASLEASEALKLLVAPAKRNRGLLAVDVWELSFEQLTVERDPECPACGARTFPFLEGREEYLASPLCGADSVQMAPPAGLAVDLESLAARLAAVGEVRRTPFLLEADVEDVTLLVFGDGRVIVRGSTDPVRARVLYSRYVGQ